MLELKPCCENCEKLLPPDSTEARICSYECAFCADCVENVLMNVCPNCGGGFVPRPVRPATERRPKTGLAHHPATTERTVKKVDPQAHVAFAEKIAAIPPEKR